MIVRWVTIRHRYLWLTRRVEPCSRRLSSGSESPSSRPSRIESFWGHARCRVSCCPDQGVELTKVLSEPGGVKAVVSSTREVTVMPGEHGPGIVSGTIEVGPTAVGRAPLRIPVVRYHSSLAKSLTLRTDGSSEWRRSP